ncbi:putative bifunctional diguanylate cyclase/phosphodiesterase [Pokkaliibacter sp. CJK22405]|uniref:putative bifunctional diguanylate cyclase/phosphodiesterase n=1 Tax=Pokkaliibacter sp. CJK22405 TaxID=3384615 RepID=UPI003984A425
MTGVYDWRLVVLSILVAVAASYTTLDIANRLVSRIRARTWPWILGGALAMGTGIWAMHFIAMLAWSLPIEMGYDISLTATSWLMAVMACALALMVVAEQQLSWARLLAAGFFMALAICGMHYVGMGAMRMHPAITYDPLLFTASALIAFVASIAAMWICFKLRSARGKFVLLHRLGAAGVMAIAVAGMHYTGMAAAIIPADSVCLAASDLNLGWLAAWVALASFTLLGMITIVSMIDQHLEYSTLKLVDSLSEANARLLHRSLHDPLTELPNRMLLEDRVSQALHVSQREKTKFALIYIDLDGFKVVNDSFGHHVGDELLCKASRAIENIVRGSDTLARVGGDEFILLVNDLKEENQIVSVCAKVQRAVAAINEAGKQPLGISASMGIAIGPDDGESTSQLMANADAAMYHVKTHGKNGYQFYQQEMNKAFVAEYQLQQELREALRDDKLMLYYQPKLTTNHREIVGAEALLRWNHAERGMVPPDIFVATAERFGLIFELDAWVLRTACRHIRHWQDSGLEVPTIAVNLSALRLRQEDLVDEVEACLQEFGVEPGKIIFEITETAEMQDILKAVDTLARLNTLGIHIALDDFGTGYSSLTHLQLFPMQQLKIDKSFIHNLIGDNNRAEIVQSIISLAHALKLKVVAEGVETEDQMACLLNFKCDEVQGYLLGRPMPEDQFRQLLKQVAVIPATTADAVPLISKEELASITAIVPPPAHP